MNGLKFYTVCFYGMPSPGLSKYIEIKLQTFCFYLMQSIFKKKKRSGTTLPASFSAYFYCYILLTDRISLVTFTLWDIALLQLFVNQAKTT